MICLHFTVRKCVWLCAWRHRLHVLYVLWTTCLGNSQWDFSEYVCVRFRLCTWCIDHSEECWHLCTGWLWCWKLECDTKEDKSKTATTTPWVRALTVGCWWGVVVGGWCWLCVVWFPESGASRETQEGVEEDRSVVKPKAVSPSQVSSNRIMLSHCCYGILWYSLHVALAGWLLLGWLAICEWRAGWLTEWVTCWLAEWVTCWLAEWLAGWLNEWHAGWVTSWLSDWLAGWMSDMPAEWLAGWPAEWVLPGREMTSDLQYRPSGQEMVKLGSYWMTGWLPHSQVDKEGRVECFQIISFSLLLFRSFVFLRQFAGGWLW